MSKNQAAGHFIFWDDAAIFDFYHTRFNGCLIRYRYIGTYSENCALSTTYFNRDLALPILLSYRPVNNLTFDVTASWRAWLRRRSTSIRRMRISLTSLANPAASV